MLFLTFPSYHKVIKFAEMNRRISNVLLDYVVINYEPRPYPPRPRQGWKVICNKISSSWYGAFSTRINPVVDK